MNYEEALKYMQGRYQFGIKLGNDRFEVLLDRLGNPHRGYGIAHIAGTKGKGSTTAMLAAILKAHDFKTGGYFSPYVYDVRERVQINGEMISREDFARLVTIIRPHIEALEETPFGPTTEFELKTALGFLHFAEQKVDCAAIEVGIGGRLDATNVVSPLVSVITNIGLDHTHILGDTHAKIAYEKAGIIKQGVPCLTATTEPSALEVIRKTAEEREAPIRYVIAGDPGLGASKDKIVWFPEGEGFTVRTVHGEYLELVTGMSGEYQRINAACAVGAVEVMAAACGFNLDIEAIREGLRLAYVPGRFETIRRNPTVIVDGAHNALAAAALAAEVRKLSYRRLLLVIGAIAGHDPEEILAELAPIAFKVYATQPSWMKALPAATIAEAARKFCSSVETITPPLEAALAALAEASPEDLILVTGSFYMLGDVKREELG
jgi:dihydrofolate synthase/folylpolyglutamate synthase